MEKEESEYLIPPRLNKAHHLYGFTFSELFLGVGAFVLAIPTGLFFLLPISAAILVTSFRNPKTERNARDYFRLLYRFYGKPQQFHLKECEKGIENDQPDQL